MLIGASLVTLAAPTVTASGLFAFDRPMLARTTANTRPCEETIRATALLPCIGSVVSISERSYGGGDDPQGLTQRCHEHPSGTLTSLSVVYGRALTSVSIDPQRQSDGSS